MSCGNQCHICPKRLECATYKNTNKIIDLLCEQNQNQEQFNLVLIEVLENICHKLDVIESKVDRVIKCACKKEKESEEILENNIVETPMIETKTKKGFLGLGKEKVVAVNAEE